MRTGISNLSLGLANMRLLTGNSLGFSVKKQIESLRK